MINQKLKKITALQDLNKNEQFKFELEMRHYIHFLKNFFMKYNLDLYYVKYCDGALF